MQQQQSQDQKYTIQLPQASSQKAKEFAGFRLTLRERYLINFQKNQQFGGNHFDISKIDQIEQIAVVWGSRKQLKELQIDILQLLESNQIIKLSKKLDKKKDKLKKFFSQINYALAYQIVQKQFNTVHENQVFNYSQNKSLQTEHENEMFQFYRQTMQYIFISFVLLNLDSSIIKELTNEFNIDILQSVLKHLVSKKTSNSSSDRQSGFKLPDGNVTLVNIPDEKLFEIWHLFQNKNENPVVLLSEKKYIQFVNVIKETNSINSYQSGLIQNILKNLSNEAKIDLVYLSISQKLTNQNIYLFVKTPEDINLANQALNSYRANRNTEIEKQNIQKAADSALSLLEEAKFEDFLSFVKKGEITQEFYAKTADFLAQKADQNNKKFDPDFVVDFFLFLACNDVNFDVIQKFLVEQIDFAFFCAVYFVVDMISNYQTDIKIFNGQIAINPQNLNNYTDFLFEIIYSQDIQYFLDQYDYLKQTQIFQNQILFVVQEVSGICQKQKNEDNHFIFMLKNPLTQFFSGQIQFKQLFQSVFNLKKLAFVKFRHVEFEQIRNALNYSQFDEVSHLLQILSKRKMFQN